MNSSAQEKNCQSGDQEGKALRLIGQDMHILNPAFCRAIEARDSRALAAMAVRQAEAGAEALDLNLGPAKKHSGSFAWAVEVVREAVGLPLFVCAPILSMPDLLRRHQGGITVNSVTADPASLAADMEQAQRHQVELVVLLVRPGLAPFTAEDRLLIAAEVLATAARVGFPLANLYVDPLFRPSPDPVRQGMPDLDPVLDALAALPLLGWSRVRSIAALSSASAFLPDAKRPAFHQSLLPLLAAVGLDAVILNCHDRMLMAAARQLGVNPPPSVLAATLSA